MIFLQTYRLALASIEYLTIYNTYQEEREPKYKAINNILKKDIIGNEEEIEQIITQNTVKLIKEYFGINNDVDDPEYINRNRLMHGIMDIESIKKIDCIKLIYLLGVLSTIKIKLVEDKKLTDIIELTPTNGNKIKTLPLNSFKMNHTEVFFYEKSVLFIRNKV